MSDSGRTLVYHPLFDCDVREAAGWYDRRSTGLGTAFVELVRQRVNDVIAQPERFARLPCGCRYARVKRFPYLVLFDVNGEQLLLLGVVHTARSEQKWLERRERD